MTVTGAEMAYFAGIVDGEGSFTCFTPGYARRFAYVYSCLSVSNTSRTMIDWLQGHFGGYVSSHRRKPTDTRRPAWRWQPSTRDMVEVIRGVFPYLRVKRRQALVALLMLATRSPLKRSIVSRETAALRHGYRNLMLRLNSGRV